MNTTTTPRPDGQAEQLTEAIDIAMYQAGYMLELQEREVVLGAVTKHLATPQAAAAGEAPDWPEKAAREISAFFSPTTFCQNLDAADIAAIIRKHSLAFAKEEGRDTERLTDYDKAILTIASWDLRYHALKSAAASVVGSARNLSNHQCAVLSSHLESLSSQLEQKTPDWPSPTQPDKKSG
jgi:transcription termination factor NusB